MANPVRTFVINGVTYEFDGDGGGGASIVVDTELDRASSNPVENRVVAREFDIVRNKEWVQIATVTKSNVNMVQINSAVSMYDFTELNITGSCSLIGSTSYVDILAYLGDGIPTATLISHAFTGGISGVKSLSAQFQNTAVGIVNTYAFGSSDTSMPSGTHATNHDGGCSYFDGTKISDIKYFKIIPTANIQDININIYAR